MSNFWSELGQGLQNFGQQRQARQYEDQEQARVAQERLRRQQELDRNYAWEVASNLAPDQELDDDTAAVFTKAGPEIGAYIAIDPLTGKRKWKGTQQQQTGAARERAAQETAERQNAVLKAQQDELTRQAKLNETVAAFTKATGRRPTRDELYKFMSETGAMDPKQMVEWDMEDKRIKSQEAIAARALAAAGRDNRWVPGAGTGPKPPVQLDPQQLINEARRAFASGRMDQTEYQNAIKEIGRVGNLQRAPLQTYMNELQGDLTEFHNRQLPQGTQPKQFGDYRNPDAIQKYLEYIQGDSDWQAQAQADLQDPQNIQRYIDFVKQIQQKWQTEAPPQQQEAPWWQVWR